jgi:hypothetical protein
LGNVGQSGFACGSSNFALIEQGEDFNLHQTITLSCGLGSRLGKLLHMGLVADDEGTCGALFDEPYEPEGILDPKYHSKNMEVHKEGKTYEHSFFRPIDSDYTTNF